MLEVRRLRLLAELRDRGTLAAVARAVHQSPSAISQQLSQLEQEVGVDLFHKVGRRVQLTHQAEILVDHARIILDRLEQAESDLAASLTSVSGTVRIAVFQSAAIALMPQFLSAMGTRHPELRVELTQSENSVAQHDTWSRDFDMLLTHRYPGESTVLQPEVDERLLISDGLRLAVPRAGSPWSRASSLADVADAPWTMEPLAISSGRWAHDVCQRAGFQPDIRFTLTDLYAQAGLVESGHAVALFPDLFARRFSDSIRLVDLHDRPERHIVTAVRQSLVASPRIRACRAALSVIASALPSVGDAARGGAELAPGPVQVDGAPAHPLG